MTRRTSLLVLATVGACVVQLGASAGTGPIRGSVTSTDRTWICKGPVALDSVTVTMTAAAPGGASATDAIHLASGCTGRIGRVEVTTSIADGIKVAQGVHDLTIGGGRVRCLAKTPCVHQDGIQVMGGSNITLTGIIVDCGRPQDDLINSNLFVNQGGGSTEPPTDVVCDLLRVRRLGGPHRQHPELGAVRGRRLDALPRAVRAADACDRRRCGRPRQRRAIASARAAARC